MRDEELYDMIPFLHEKTVEQITSEMVKSPELNKFFTTYQIDIDQITRVLKDNGEPVNRIQRFKDALMNFYSSELMLCLKKKNTLIEST